MTKKSREFSNPKIAKHLLSLLSYQIFTNLSLLEQVAKRVPSGEKLIWVVGADVLHTQTQTQFQSTSSGQSKSNVTTAGVAVE